MCLMFPMFVVLVLSIHIVMWMYLMSMYPMYVYPIHSYSIYVWYNTGMLLCILSVSDKYVYPIHRPHPLVRLHTGGLPWRWRRASCGGGACCGGEGFSQKRWFSLPPSLMMMCGVECV